MGGDDFPHRIFIMIGRRRTVDNHCRFFSWYNNLAASPMVGSHNNINRAGYPQEKMMNLSLTSKPITHPSSIQQLSRSNIFNLHFSFTFALLLSSRVRPVKSRQVCVVLFSTRVRISNVFVGRDLIG